MSKKILVVEDERHIAEGIKLNLSLQGYEVDHVDNGLKALEKWYENNYDLMVLDIMLPGLDGHGVLKEIRVYVVIREKNANLKHSSAVGIAELCSNWYFVKKAR